MKHLTLTFGLMASATLMQATAASAAPQILAVMAAFGPQQMTCTDTTCTTTLTSYCLQHERDVPTTGQAYYPAHVDHFTLVLTNAQGVETTIAATDHVNFRSQRGYATVRATIGKETLREFGAVAARIEPLPGATLVPVAVPDEPNPISEAELAYVSRSLRDHGEDIVDAKPEAHAAQVLNRLAATIIPSARATDDGLQQLWHDVIHDLGPASPSGQDAIKRARDIYNWCQSRSSYHSMSGIKSCLEFKHDDAIMKLNTDYWESQPGY